MSARKALSFALSSLAAVSIAVIGGSAIPASAAGGYPDVIGERACYSDVPHVRLYIYYTETYNDLSDYHVKYYFQQDRSGAWTADGNAHYFDFTSVSNLKPLQVCTSVFHSFSYPKPPQ